VLGDIITTVEDVDSVQEVLLLVVLFIEASSKAGDKDRFDSVFDGERVCCCERVGKDWNCDAKSWDF